MEETPSWLQEMEDEASLNSPKSMVLEAWIESLSDDIQEESKDQEPSFNPQAAPSTVTSPDLESNNNLENQIIAQESCLDSEMKLMFPDVSPRISSDSSVFTGSFSSPLRSHSFIKDSTYRSTPLDIETERLTSFPTPQVCLPIFLPFPIDYQTDAQQTITEKGLIQSFKGLMSLQSDISISPLQYQDVLTKTLSYSINFLHSNPKQIQFFTEIELITSEEDEERQLFYCDIICNCVLNYLHNEDIAMKVIILFYLVTLEHASLLLFDPVIRDPTSDRNKESDTSSNRDRLIKTNPCEIVRKILENHGSSNQSILDICLVLICNLSRIKGCRDYFTINCSITIIQVVKDYLKSTVTPDKCEFSVSTLCKLLCSLADNVAHDFWIQSDIYRLLQDAICVYSNNFYQMEWICKVVYCFNQGRIFDREMLVSTELCQQLISHALVIQATPPTEMIVWACLAIGSVTFKCDLTKDLMGTLGVCSYLSRLLEEYGYSHPDIVECTCYAISNVASQHQSNQLSLINLGIDELLLSFLRLYSHSFTVVREILVALHSLLHLNENWYKIDSKEQSIENYSGNEYQKYCHPKATKICEILLHSIEEFERKRRSYWKSFGIDVQNVVPWLWYAVSALSSHPSGRSILWACNIEKFIISAIRYCVNDLTLRCVFMTLCYFIQDFPTHGSDLFSQIARYLPNTLNRIPLQADTISVGCDLISKLAVHRPLVVILSNSKVCQTMIKLLQRHQSDKRIVEIIFFALKVLCTDNLDNVKKFDSCNACEVILHTMVLHQCVTYPIALWGCQIIQLLCYSKQSIKRINSLYISQCIHLSFNSHISALSVLQEICHLLFHLCTLSTNLPCIHVLLSSGTCEMLLNILIICHEKTLEQESEASPATCTLSCLQAIEGMLEQSHCEDRFSRMGCHVLLIEIIRKYIHSDTHIVLCYQILKRILEANLLLRKQLVKVEISTPIVQSYNLVSISTKDDLSHLILEKMINISDCICLLLSISFSDTSNLFIVRDIFVHLLQSDIVPCLGNLLSLHFKLDFGERVFVNLLRVISSLLNCQNIFYPMNPPYPVLNLRASAFVILSESTNCSGSTEENSLINQMKATNLMPKLIELLSIYLNEDRQVVVWIIRCLTQFLRHDSNSQLEFDSLGLCERSTQLLGFSNLNQEILIDTFSLIYEMSLFNLRLKLKYISLSSERTILQYLQQYFMIEELVSTGILALSSLATGHDMLNTPIYYPLGVICSVHVNSRRVCLASCYALYSITRNTRETALALTSFSTSLLSFRSHSSSILQLTQSAISSVGHLLSSSEICRSVLLAVLNVILLYSRDIEDPENQVSCQEELKYLVCETNMLKYVGLIFVRHLGLEDICRHALLLTRLITSYADATELSQNFNNWKHFLVDQKDPLSDQILGICHGLGMNNIVFSVLETYSQHIEILTHCVTCLYQLSLHQSIRSYLANAKVLGMIISLFHSGTMNEDLLVAILQLISRLCEGNPKSSKYLVESGICELLVWSLDEYPSSALLSKFVCRCVLFLTSVDHSSKVMFHACSSWITLSTCLESHQLDKSVTLEWCLSIYSLCVHSPDNIKKFATSRVCLSLTEILVIHEEIEQICLATLRVLSLLSLPYQEHLTQLHQISDLTKYLSSLRTQIPVIAARYSKSDQVILWSSRVLNTVYSDESSLTTNHLSPEQRSETETLMMIISNLESYFSSNPAIVLESMISIGNALAANPQQFREISICSKIRDTLRHYSANIPIVIACCKAISSLTLEQHGAEISSSKLVPLLLEVLSQRYQKNAHVMEWGCHAITAIAMNEQNRTELVTYGACEIVVGALQIGTGNGDALVAILLQKPSGSVSHSLAACEALYALGRENPKYCEKLGLGGACIALTRIIQKYSDSAEIAAAVCKGFATLTEHCPSNRAKLTNFGACRLILVALEMHHSYQPAAMWACRAVERMSSAIDGVPETKFPVTVCTYVLLTMQFHQGNFEVASAGCSALSSLTYTPSFILPLLQHHCIEILLFSIQLCVFHETTIIAACSALCRLMSGNTYSIFVQHDCISTFLCLLFKYHRHPLTTYPIWFNIYKLTFCSTECCVQFLKEGICEIYGKIFGYLLGIKKENVEAAAATDVEEDENQSSQLRSRDDEKDYDGEDEEDWLSVLPVMSDIMTILYDKQFKILQQELQTQPSLIKLMLLANERASGSMVSACSCSEQLISEISAVMRPILRLLPPSQEIVPENHQEEKLSEKSEVVVEDNEVVGDVGGEK